MKTSMLGTSLVAVLALTLVGGLAFARGPGGGPGRGPGGMKDPQRFEQGMERRLNDLLDKIQATPEQRLKIVAIKDRLLPKARETFGDRGGLHRQLTEKWTAEKIDAKALHAQVDQRTEELKQFQHEAVDALVEAHQVLTPEQRAQVAAELKQGRFHWGRHR